MARFELNENGVDITIEVHVTVEPEIKDLAWECT